MKNFFFTLLICTLFTSLEAQYISSVSTPDTNAILSIDSSEVGFQLAQTITSEGLQQHLFTLASDEMEGRETGEEGNYMAAEYIADQLSDMGYPKIGLENSHYQGVAFTSSRWKANEIYVNGNKYKHLWDYLSFQDKNQSIPELNTDEVIYLGWGIDDPEYSDYKKNKVRGKVIMIYNGEPLNKDGKSHITGTTTLSDWNLNKKLIAAKNHGVKLVLVIEENIKELLMQNRSKVLGGGMALGNLKDEDSSYANSIHISTTIAEDIIGKKLKKVTKSRKRSQKKGKACDVKMEPALQIKQDIERNVLEGYNVMAYTEGTDKKDELVIVSAHFDHVGYKGESIFNGADDNASGSSSVLEIAEALSIAKKEGRSPRRSVLCIWVTGEEKGLLGSKYYVENPIFPIENTIANVNIDMIGRSDQKYANRSDYIYVIGSDRLSTDLHKINEKVNNEKSLLTLDYTYNSEQDPNRYYYRSDHYNFAEKGIPAIFFFSGVHEDYHQPSDTADKIDFQKSENISRHIFQLIWELANREDRIVVDGL